MLISVKWVADRIAQLRENRGVSAREMSYALQQSESYINKIENLRSRPSWEMFFFICNYLDVSPSEFFNEENSYPMQIKEIVDELKKLDKESLEAVLNLTKQLNRNKG